MLDNLFLDRFGFDLYLLSASVSKHLMRFGFNLDLLGVRLNKTSLSFGFNLDLLDIVGLIRRSVYRFNLVCRNLFDDRFFLRRLPSLRCFELVFLSRWFNHRMRHFDGSLRFYDRSRWFDFG